MYPLPDPQKCFTTGQVITVLCNAGSGGEMFCNSKGQVVEIKARVQNPPLPPISLDPRVGDIRIGRNNWYREGWRRIEGSFRFSRRVSNRQLSGCRPRQRLRTPLRGASMSNGTTRRGERRLGSFLSSLST